MVVGIVLERPVPDESFFDQHAALPKWRFVGASGGAPGPEWTRVSVCPWLNPTGYVFKPGHTAVHPCMTDRSGPVGFTRGNQGRRRAPAAAPIRRRSGQP